MYFKKQRISALVSVLVLALALCLGCIPAHAANPVQHYGSVPIWIGQAEVDYQAEQILKEIPTAGKSKREQIRAVYDWVIRNCKRENWDGKFYFDKAEVEKNSSGKFVDDANSALRAGTLLIRTDYAWDFADNSYAGGFFFFPYDSNTYISSFSYDMMLMRTGNCAHYASLLAVLLGHLGFDCRLIDGEFINGNGTRMEHKWNYVLVDGKYYWLDPRIDHANYVRTGKISYSYFMKEDTTAWAKSHAWDHTYSDWLAANAKNIVKDYDDMLEAAANGPKHTVTAKVQGNGTVSGGGTYAEGETVNLTALAGTNAVFDGWYDIQGNRLSTGTTYQLTLTENVEIIARFINLYSVEVRASRSGTVSGAGQYRDGTVVSLQARPASGHTFEGWYTPKGVLLGSETNYSFTISENETIYAMFSEDRFVDVANSWYTRDVMDAVEKGYIVGKAAFRFEPGREITRAEVVTMLARLDGEKIKGSGWQQQAMDWARDNGVSDGTKPGNDITREELAVMLWRYAAKPDANLSVLDSYTDSSNIHNWSGFRQAVAWAVENGLIKGVGGGRLNPQGTATRAQAVTILLRYCEKLG